MNLKGIDGGPHKRRNMWFNSMIREEPYPGLTWGVHWKLLDLSAGEESGIPSVAVKCVDIRRNTSGEGGLLLELNLLRKEF